MEQTATPTHKTVSPQALAARLGLSPRRLRQIIRSEYPRDTKKRRWEISETLARKVKRDYRAKLKEKEAKKAEVNKAVQGKARIEPHQLSC